MTSSKPSIPSLPQKIGEAFWNYYKQATNARIKDLSTQKTLLLLWFVFLITELDILWTDALYIPSAIVPLYGLRVPDIVGDLLRRYSFLGLVEKAILTAAPLGKDNSG